jgi:hypothetical protein
LHASKGRKHAQGESTSSEERPSQRARPNSSGLVAENRHTTSDDDDDDNGLPFWNLDKKGSYCFIRLSEKYIDIPQVAEDYMDAEDLFHALRAQFKASALVDFHGTYSIEEDDLIEPKECTRMLAEELWKVTGYRFT